MKSVSKLSAGAYVIVDGSEGVVIDEPDDAVIQEYNTKRINFLKERKELENFRGKDMMRSRISQILFAAAVCRACIR